MGKRSGTNAKCTQYLNNRTRIKNKTEKLEKRLKNIKDEKSITNIKRDCKIGRSREGFPKEAFKFKEKKNVKMSV